MAVSPILLLLAIFSLIYGNGILPIEATHHVYRNLQTLSSDSSDQPYRTAYHFQPPKNWINGIDPNNHQVQNLALPKNMSDPFLREWVKSPKNPLMAPTSANMINSSSFRDPTTAWLGKDGYWRVLIGSKIHTRGMAILYKSKNFVNWVQAKQPLHSAEGTGMWECPDFYPVLNNKPSSTIGLDTSVNGDNVRHVLKLVQWPVVELESLRVNPVHWPTKVVKGGEMLQVTGVTAAQADVEISFDVNEFGKGEVLDQWVDPQILCSRKGAAVKGGLGPFGLLVFASRGLQEYTAVFFRIFRYQNKNLVLMCSDQSRSSLNKDNDMTTYGTFVDMDPLHEKLSLRTLIDHSVVESFGGEGRACITARVYPTIAINEKAQLYAFNNGTAAVKITRLSAWSMEKAKIN
ncbi:hypothetical protein JHK87_041132 [Glycine soja]|nr:hypothetical protein JHK87_041132 [Glycine soja]